MGAFIPVATNSGIQLWLGNHRGASGGYEDTPAWLRAQTRGMSEVERDRFYWREGLAFIRAHPLEALSIVPGKFWHFAARDTVTVGWIHFDSLASPRPLWLKYVFAGIAQAYYVLFLLVALYGAASGAFRQPEGRWMGLVGIYYVAVHLVLRGDPRYHLPLLPLVAVFAAFGVARWAAERQSTAPVQQHQERAQAGEAPSARACQA